MKYYFYIIFILLTSSQLGYSISESDVVFSRYGLYTNLGLSNHSTQFSSLPRIPNCCPQFKNGQASSILFGGIYEYNINSFAFEAKFGIDMINGSFKSNEFRTLGLNGVPVDGKIEHTIDYKLNLLSTVISSRYYFYKGFSAAIGASLSYITNSSYHQYEEISSSAGKVYFLDSNGNNTGSSIRNEFRGSLPNLNNFQFSGLVGISYDYPIKKDRTIIIRPEISYQQFFSNVLDDTKWAVSTLRFGISLLYSSYHIQPIVDESQIDDEASKIENEKILERLREDEIKRLEYENLLALERAKKDSLEREIKYKDSLFALTSKQMKEENSLIEQERDEFSRMIEEENRKAGSICRCYIVLFNSSTDKQESEKLFTTLNKSGFTNVILSKYVDNYVGETYYRVQSECYSDHIKAFDERIRFLKETKDLNINPRIICNR